MNQNRNRSKFLFLLCSLSLLSAGVGLYASPIRSFTISHEVINRKTKILIRWDVTGVDSVYISNIGVVSGTSFVEKDISRTTRFTMFVETPDSIYSRTLEVTFKGLKSVTSYPNVSDYDPELHKSITIGYSGLPQLLDDLTREFGNDFYLRESYNRKVERATLETNYKSAQGLVRQREKHVRYKRVSYLIAVSRLQGDEKESLRKYAVQIYSIVEFQRMADKVWEKEKDEDVYTEAIGLLTVRINKLMHGHGKQ